MFRNHGKCLELLKVLLEKVYCETSQGLIHGIKPEKLKSAVSWHFVRALHKWDLRIFHLVGPIKQTTQKKSLSFCWFPDTVLSVVPEDGNTEAQVTSRSGIVGASCALYYLCANILTVMAQTSCIMNILAVSELQCLKAPLCNHYIIPSILLGVDKKLLPSL